MSRKFLGEEDSARPSSGSQVAFRKLAFRPRRLRRRSLVDFAAGGLCALVSSPGPVNAVDLRGGSRRPDASGDASPVLAALTATV